MYIGIDLGGTNIGAALVDENGKIVKRTSIHADTSGGAKTVIDGLLIVCDNLLDDTPTTPLSIGIGVPGTVNDEMGVVVFTPNLPLRSVNATQGLYEKYGCPIRLGNDANCAALGETVAGGAKGAQDVVFITLGTGLGGGIIQGGRLITGLSGAASELGHMVINIGGHKCGCGRYGCWETYASASGLIRTAIEIMGRHQGSLLWRLCNGLTETVDGRMVFDAFRSDDRAAQIIVEQYIEYLAIGFVNLVNMLEPDMICVGGGISNAWDCLAEPLTKLVNSDKYFRFSPKAPQTRIVKAELGNDAGIIGAAMLGREI